MELYLGAALHWRVIELSDDAIVIVVGRDVRSNPSKSKAQSMRLGRTESKIALGIACSNRALPAALKRSPSECLMPDASPHTKGIGDLPKGKRENWSLM